MTPTLLAEYMDVLRSRGAVSAELVLPEATLRVVFAPSVDDALPPGDGLTPGGWKGPAHLDRDPLEDERSVP